MNKKYFKKYYLYQEKIYYSRFEDDFCIDLSNTHKELQKGTYSIYEDEETQINNIKESSGLSNEEIDKIFSNFKERKNNYTVVIFEHTQKPWKVEIKDIEEHKIIYNKVLRRMGFQEPNYKNYKENIQESNNLQIEKDIDKNPTNKEYKLEDNSTKNIDNKQDILDKTQNILIENSNLLEYKQFQNLEEIINKKNNEINYINNKLIEIENNLINSIQNLQSRMNIFENNLEKNITNKTNSNIEIYYNQNLENYKKTKEYIENLEKKINEKDNKINFLNNKIDIFEEKFNKIESELRNSIKNLENKINIFENKIKQNQDSFDNLEKNISEKINTNIEIYYNKRKEEEKQKIEQNKFITKKKNIQKDIDLFKTLSKLGLDIGISQIILEPNNLQELILLENSLKNINIEDIIYKFLEKFDPKNKQDNINKIEQLISSYNLILIKPQIGDYYDRDLHQSIGTDKNGKRGHICEIKSFGLRKDTKIVKYADVIIGE